MLMPLIFILFSLAILLGIYLLRLGLLKKHIPKGLTFIHGPLGVMGFIMLLVYSINNKPPLLSLLLLFITSGIGAVIVFRDITGKTFPNWLAILHGLLAILGVMLLYLFIKTY